MTKICHLTSAHNSDDIRIFHKECISLAKAGFEVHLIAPSSTEEKIEGVHIHSVSRFPGRIARMTKTVNAVYAKAMEMDADIYHLHDPELLRIAGKLKKAGKKVIYDAHEDLPRQIMAKHYIKKGLRKLIASSIELYEDSRVSKIDYVITATPYIAKRFKRINAECTDVNNYPFKNELYINAKWENKEKAICYIGGISRKRGAREIVEAVGLLENVKLYLAGLFTESDLEEELSNLPGWKNVTYLGKLDRHGVKEVLSKSKIGLVTLMPTPNHLMSHPIKLFEYMSASIPFIASDFPYWKEMLNGSNAGFFVEPSDPEQIAAAIINLLDNDKLAETMGLNGRNLILNQYNWESESKKLVEIYKNL